MNREQIIDIWTKANGWSIKEFNVTITELERFAALVDAAKEQEHKEAMRWDIHSCGPTCKRYACVATREAVAAERDRMCEQFNIPKELAHEKAKSNETD